MDLRDIERRMRAREAAHEQTMESGIFAVIRLDGRGFTGLTEALGVEKPFDGGFRDKMVATARHLMMCGIPARYGYTQSDEISLVLEPDHHVFGRRLQKSVSVLAGEASAALSLGLGMHAVFDARVLALHSVDEVSHYLRWRQADARRNARFLYCYWLLRRQGASSRRATKELRGLGAHDQEALLRECGRINLEAVPAWQRNGIGLRHETFEREGTDPRSGESVTVVRRRIRVEEVLPVGPAYTQWISRLIGKEAAPVL